MSDKMYTFYEATCPFCRKIHSIKVPIDELYQYEVLGELAQESLVSLSENEREGIISGLCPDCIKKIFIF
jgi:hypothetical protein